MNEALCLTCGRSITEDGLEGLCASCMLGLVAKDSFVPPPGKERRAAPLLTIPGYEVREEIARGGMGIVYRATQTAPQREVALKMLLPHHVASPGMLERFCLEARAIAALEHPAILPVHHVGEHHGLPFFTMKLAAGGTLAQRKDRLTGDWRATAALVATIADAVQFAHERGVLHRDIKPGNVLFDEGERAYVSDFGLAKVVGLETDLTRSVEFLGTPHYVAPEVAARSAKEATTASDIYSLGAILYELLAGRPPFEAEGVPALLRKIAEDDPLPPSECHRARFEASPTSASAIKPSRAPSTAARVPRDLEVVCLKCLAKEPARRYASARELADDLRRWLEGRTIVARPATALERVHSWARRNPALTLMIGVLVTVLVFAGVWEVRSYRRLQYALSESLLRQAQLERASGRPGQRFETLALVSRAAQHFQASGGNLSSSNLVALRTEIASALALSDFRPVQRWPVHIPSLDNELDFTANLDRYVACATDGGFFVKSTQDGRTLRYIAGHSNNPAIKLRMHPHGLWAAVRFQDGQGELHSLASHTLRPAGVWPGTPNAGVLFEFDPSGRSLAVVVPAPRDRRVTEIVDLSTGLTNCRIPAAGAAALVFDPTGTHLAIGGTELTVWRLTDTNRLWSAPLTHETGTLAWAPHGNRIAVAMDRRRPAGKQPLLKASPVLFFNSTNGEQQSVFAEFGSRVARLAFHPDGRHLVVATWESGLLWGTVESAGERLQIEGAHRALLFASDGRRLGYAPTREEIGLLEVAIPTAFRRWQPHARPAEESFALDGSKDGRWVVTASSVAVHLWDAASRIEIDSRPLPARGGWVEVLFGSANECIYSSAASFGVRRIALTNSPDGTLRFGDERTVGEPNSFLTVGFAEDGRSLIVTENRGRAGPRKAGPTVWLWPDADPSRARKLADDYPLLGYRVVPGSRWAVTTALVAPDVSIWNFDTGERLHNLGLRGRASCVPVPNGRWLVAKTAEEFGVWEVGTWRPLARWRARPDETPMNLFSSPDSRSFATHNPNGRFVLRGLPGGNEVVLLDPPRPIAVQFHQFSADGSRLLLMDNNGQIYEWNLAEIRGELGRLKLDWQ